MNDQTSNQDKISQDSINKALWAACDTFRGTISADTYKDFILTMLFLKYISDVWQDHYDGYKAEYGDEPELIDEMMKNERFVLPKQASFYALWERRHEPGNGERILIVDDEQALRTTARIILEDAGFVTTTAKSTEEALETLKQSEDDEPYDVILTDVVMSGRSGPQLIIEALRQNPRYGVVFMSGYPARSRKELDNLLGNYVFVKKPFRPTQLQKAIHEALALRAERQQRTSSS